MDTFRTLHHGPEAFVIPNPWDVGSAVMLQHMGFRALATTSAGMAFAMGRREGQPDRDAVLDYCRAIVGATSLPVSADLEYGFGHAPQSCADTIHAVAQTGVAGCSLEDHTGDPANPIFDFNLAVDRIAAASEAVRALPQDMVFTARAENFLWDRHDLDDTIRRLQAFEEAGADVLYAPGITDLDAIRTLCASVTKPVNVIMGGPRLQFTVQELSNAGVARISVGSAFARRAYGAFIDAAREVADKGVFTQTAKAMRFADIEHWLPEDRLPEDPLSKD